LTAPIEWSIGKSAVRPREEDLIYLFIRLIMGLPGMKTKGTSLIFVNDREEVLLILRDDDPGIACPNMWDLPGGHVEDGETPMECIRREMKEELGLELEGIAPFSVVPFDDRTEFVFWIKMNVSIRGIRLTEGQRLRWFSRDEVERTPLAFGFNGILAAFFGDRSRSD
jgi:8-oxo-dGTP diphosphatase